MSSADSPESVMPKQEAFNGSCFLSGDVSKPFLAVVEQPQSRFRFRYKSEMTGTHGSLMGEGQDKSKKTYPTVKLGNFNGPQAIIRCSLATNELVPLPHVHSLEGDAQGEGADYQEVVVSALNDYTASFQGITIIHTGKKHVKEVFERRLKALYLQDAALSEVGSTALSNQVLQKVREVTENRANSIDLHAVRLKFEALLPSEIPGLYHYICPPAYSTPVCNLKATQTGDLRIVRIDKHVSCVTGNEEVFIFVEKVNKRNIKVRFFELDEETGQEIWHAFAEFSELDVHHQYAIAFKTPPYRDLDIDSDVDVYLQLFRPQDQAVSDPKPFKYKPREQPRKRARVGVGAGESVDATMNNSGYRSSSQGSVIVSPTTQAFSKNGSSGSSDSASDAAYIARLRSLYNVPARSRAFPATTQTRGLQGTMAPALKKESGYAEDIQQMYHQLPYDVPYMYQSPQYVQPRIMLIPQQSKTASSGGRPQTVPTASRSPEEEEVLSSAINDYLKQIGAQTDIMPPELSRSSPLEAPIYESPGAFTEADCPTTMSLEQYLKGMEAGDYGNSTPQLSDECNQAGDWAGRVDSPFFISRGLQDLNLSETKREGTQFEKDFGVARMVGLSLGNSLRTFAVTGNILPLLVKMSSLVALQDDKGDNGLHAALSHYQKESFQLLLSAVVWSKSAMDVIDVKNAQNQTPLHIAVMTNNTDAVKLLMLAGANPDIPDRNGNTVLHLASSDLLLVDILRILTSVKSVKDQKACLERKNYTDGYNALHIATSRSWKTGIELLLAAGADPKERDYRLGRTALHIAVDTNSIDIVRLILNSGRADPDLQAYDGTTPLHLAVLKRNEEICIELLRNKANPHLSSYVSVEESYVEDGSDTDDEDIAGYPETAMELAENIPRIRDILLKQWEPQDVLIPEAEVVIAETNVKSEPDSLSGPLDSGIDINSTSSVNEQSLQKGLKSHLDEGAIEKLSTIFQPKSEAFARLVNDPDFQLFRPALVNKENPAKYLLSNLPVSLSAFRAKLSNMKLKEALEVVDQYLIYLGTVVTEMKSRHPASLQYKRVNDA